MSICENGTCKIDKIVFFFEKKDCPECKKAKEILSTVKEDNDFPLVYFDIDTVEGLSKAAYYNIFEVPVILLTERGKEVKRFKGASEIKEIKNFL